MHSIVMAARSAVNIQADSRCNDVSVVEPSPKEIIPWKEAKSETMEKTSCERIGPQNV